MRSGRISFLIGRKPRQAVPSTRLRQSAAAGAGVPEWLFDACYDPVGDVAETIALLLPPAAAVEAAPCTTGSSTTCWYCGTSGGGSAPAGAGRLAGDRSGTEVRLEQADQRRLPGRCLAATGDACARLVRRSVRSVVAHRLMGHWHPGRLSRPSFPRTGTRTSAGPTRSSWPTRWRTRRKPWGDAEWQAEWKWDGIRAQLIRRGGQTFIWSRGRGAGHRASSRDPAARSALPDGTVIDGEILPWRERAPLPFAVLQTADRPQDARPRRSWRSARGPHGLRSARDGRRRRPRTGRWPGGVPDWTPPCACERIRGFCCLPTARHDWRSCWSHRGRPRGAGRRTDAQTPRLALRRRPAPGRLVEVEGRTPSASTRC